MKTVLITEDWRLTKINFCGKRVVHGTDCIQNTRSDIVIETDEIVIVDVPVPCRLPAASILRDPGPALMTVPSTSCQGQLPGGSKPHCTLSVSPT